MSTVRRRARSKATISPRPFFRSGWAPTRRTRRSRRDCLEVLAASATHPSRAKMRLTAVAGFLCRRLAAGVALVLALVSAVAAEPPAPPPQATLYDIVGEL